MAVTIQRRPKQLTENYIGTYSADDLLVLLIGDEQVRFSPRGRKHCGGDWACRRSRRAGRGNADRAARAEMEFRARPPANTACRDVRRVDVRRRATTRDAGLTAVPVPPAY